MEARWSAWSEDHIAVHDVTWPEVEEALTPPIVVRKVGSGASKVLGRTFAGRYLALIVVPDEDASTVFVVTARTMDERERALYRARQRKG